MNILILLLTLAMYACTVEGTVENKKDSSSCIDTRDNEAFTIQNKDISNVRIGFGADSCFDVVDDQGQTRRLCKSHEAFIKCKTFQR